MILGGLPFLQLDRTGVALLGAIALVGVGVVSPEAAVDSLHLPTLMLLFAFMVLSAQLRLGGFYAWVTRRLGAWPLRPALLMGALIGVVGALSAVFSNDVVCLAVAPVLIDVCRRRGLAPLPYLLGLACAANIGSAATLIGNPQNMLIGARLGLSFGGYLTEALVPVVLSLLVTWAIIVVLSRGRWREEGHPHPIGSGQAAEATDQRTLEQRVDEEPELDPWQTGKGLTVALVLLLIFLVTAWPRELAALVGAGLLLTSRRLHSRRMLGLVDWELLVLFMGLFVVNHALEASGLLATGVAALAAVGLPLDQPGHLFAAAVVLSNLVSNVPAVMLLLPVATDPLAGPILALASTLAGNLLLVGSIANLIVADAAERRGLSLDWRAHARVGVPVTLATLAIAATWLLWRAGTTAAV
jgi:Na+/H+ antiporter NhaD/arsenite permease-like protein